MNPRGDSQPPDALTAAAAAPSRWQKTARFLAAPPRWLEIVIWILLVGAIAGIRLYLIHLLPTILWSRDAGSYVGSAFRWLHSGAWESDPRRGPIYSLMIGLCVKWGGSMDAVMFAQHLLGGLAILGALIVLRMMHTRRAILLIGLCGWAYAVYALPISLEHLVRNETLLFFFATVIFVSWFLALERAQPHWLWLTGLTAGLMLLTKPVFAPFPLVLVALHGWFYRGEPKLAFRQIGIFLLAFALPVVTEKVSHRWTLHRPPEPQGSILFYGRTAQFTVLDGGIEPEVKALIRQQVEDYRKRPRLDNNIVLKITIVPTLRTYYARLGKTPSELNNLCLRLALEGIRAHKAEYARQVLHDLGLLLTKRALPPQAPTLRDAMATKTALTNNHNPDPYMRAAESIQEINARLDHNHFATYRHRVREAWLFHFIPVLLTTLLLPLFVWFKKGKQQLWWLGCAAMWYFTLVLLCTVGRPLDRYLLPVVPVMFWTLSGALIAAWFWVAARWQGRAAKNSVLSTRSI